MTEYSVIGKPEYHDKQIIDIVTGRLDYAADNLSGRKLFARVAHSKYAHARVKSIDTSKALSLEGVKAVCTFQDCPMFSENILYFGQEVAAVAAIDEHTAARAAQLVEVEYEVLPATLDPDEAMKPGAPLVGTFSYTNIQSQEKTRGNLEDGFRESEIIVDETFGWTNYFQHGELETCSAVAYWTGDHLHVWTGSQSPYNQRAMLASTLKVPLNHVHLVSHGTGVGHGDKHVGDWCVVAAVLARKAGLPVQFALSRADNFINRDHQFAIKANIRIGAKRDGTITAIESTYFGDHCSNGVALVFEANETLQYTYKCPNGSFKSVSTVTNKPPTGFWRCVAHPQSTFAAEAVIEILAEKLNMNPLEFRMKNIVTPDIPDQDSGNPMSSNGLAEVLKEITNAIGWSQKWHKPGIKLLPDGRLHGIGLSAHIDGHGRMAAPVSTIVNICRDGTALILDGISRAGGGTNSAHCHIVAEVLGLRYQDVMVGEWGNTDVCAEGGFQGGSTRTITTGAAFYMAAMDARNQLVKKAADILGVPESDIGARDGVVFSKTNPNVSRSFSNIAMRMDAPIVGRGSSWGRQLQRPTAGFPAGTPCETRGACGAAVEVAVDQDTGEVEILQFVNAVDAGKAIFLKGCENQIEGGMELMAGQALFYEQLIDPGSGATLNADYVNQKWPTTADLDSDRHLAIIVESDDACGPFGCKGLGEPPVSSYGAIANAIYNATGKWVRNPPITPQKVLEALGKI